MSESSDTRALCRVLERQGALTYPLIGSSWQPEGWPDRYVCYNGEYGVWQGFLEFKSKSGSLKPKQRAVITELRKRLVNVFVVKFHNHTSGGITTHVIIENLDGSACYGGHAFKYNEVLEALCLYHVC